MVEELGPDARGRVHLRQNRDGWIEHLTFRDGKLRLEDGWPGEALEVKPILKGSTEQRYLALKNFPELWEVCGGPPLPKSV